MHTIYKITNLIDGKVYIGYTDNFKRRRQEHLREVRYARKNYPLYNAIRKHGKQAFNWEILYQSLDCEHTLSIVEPMLIREYNAHVSTGGYNLSYGGEAPMKGKKHSAETRAKMKGRKVWNKGKTFSVEARANMSAAHKGYKQTPEQIRNQTASNSAWWEIKIPEGSTLIIKGLSEFCKARKLSRGNMSRLHLGSLRYYKGYSCRKLGKGLVPPQS